MASPRLMDSTSHGMEKDLFRVSLTGFLYPVEDMIDWHSFSASCSQAIKKKIYFSFTLMGFLFLLNLLQISKSNVTLYTTWLIIIKRYVYIYINI